MIFSKIITFGAIAGLFSSAYAENFGTLTIQNECAQPITMKQIDSYNAGNLLQSFKNPEKIAPNDFKSFPWKNTKTGASFVVTRDAATSFTKLSYTIDDKYGLTYSLTDINGDPFKGEKVLLASATEGCLNIVWPDGVPLHPSLKPECDPKNSMTLTLCQSQ